MLVNNGHDITQHQYRLTPQIYLIILYVEPTEFIKIYNKMHNDDKKVRTSRVKLVIAGLDQKLGDNNLPRQKPF